MVASPVIRVALLTEPQKYIQQFPSQLPFFQQILALLRMYGWPRDFPLGRQGRASVSFKFDVWTDHWLLLIVAAGLVDLFKLCSTELLIHANHASSRHQPASYSLTHQYNCGCNQNAPCLSRWKKGLTRGRFELPPPYGDEKPAFSRQALESLSHTPWTARPSCQLISRTE